VSLIVAARIVASGRNDHGLQKVAIHFVAVQKLIVSRQDSGEIKLLKQKLGSVAFLLGMALLAPSCGAAPSNIERAQGDRQAALAAEGNRVSDNQSAINQRFRNLDEYLAWLERMEAPVDGAWYRQVSPGIYQLQTGGNLRLDDGAPGAPQTTFTREELERKFGFRK
jgi:hypothetical protein